MSMDKSKCLVLVPPVLQSETGEVFSKSYYDKHLLPFLELQFETKTVTYRCDLGEEIEAFLPDVVFVFSPCEEQTLPTSAVMPRDYATHPQIPRAGYLIVDKHSPLHYAGYQFLRKLGCCACFCSLTVPDELTYQSPDLPVYFAPNSWTITNEYYKDYGEEKCIAIGLFGGGFFQRANKHYPWRQKIMDKIEGKTPIYHAPRIAHRELIPGSHDVRFEKYGRMLNRCRLALTCGTELHYLVCKHIEIPACRCCLITEESAILKEFGFVDMNNCVFATEDDVLEKLTYLFANPSALEKITNAGYKMVHPHIDPQTKFLSFLEWLKSYRRCSDEQKVIQERIFEFSVVNKREVDYRRIENGPNVLRTLWEKGYQQLQNNRIEEAATSFQEALSYVSWCPEAIIGCAIINLFTGNLQGAFGLFVANMNHVKAHSGFDDFYDPVELAYMVVLYLCIGDTESAEKTLRLARAFHHPALAAARALTPGMSQSPEGKTNILSRLPTNHFSRQNWIDHFTAALGTSRTRRG